MHKFSLGQAVTYRVSRLVDASCGVYVVTAKLPERDGEFEYHIRSTNEKHERVARESELTAIAVGDKAAAKAKRCPPEG
jgi:hypothetical protein